MQLPRKDVLRGLTKKGFELKEKTKHTGLTYYNKQGQKTGSSTIVSRGSNYKVLGDTLLNSMADHCGLSTAQFVELVDCSMSQDEYDRLIAETE